MTSTGHDTLGTRSSFDVGGKTYTYYSPRQGGREARQCRQAALLDEGAARESAALRGRRTVTVEDVQALVDWQIERSSTREIQYRPARVLMQDFTGVPAVVDLAAMRDAMAKLGGDPQKINPLVPVHLVIDH